MPDRSSEPASVTYLDGQAAIQRLRELAQALISSRPGVQAVYLFGSLAKGRHVPGSDADLLVVLDEDDRRTLDRVPEFLRAFLEAPVAVDVFPYTSHELAQRQQAGDPFVRQMLEEAILLGSRQHEHS